MVKGSRAGERSWCREFSPCTVWAQEKKPIFWSAWSFRVLKGRSSITLEEDGYSMKLNSFGKFAVHHKPAIRRKVGFTGKMTQIPARRKIRFVSLGMLRQLEPKEGTRELAR